MTLQEFEKLVATDEALRAKLDQKKAELLTVPEKKEMLPTIMSKIVKDLGYDVPEEEFSLEQIMSREMDEDELEKVAGGDGVVSDPCYFNERCFTVIKHPESQDKEAPCWSDYFCLFFQVTYRKW